MATKAKQIVVVSDTHCGCQMGLCPPKGVMLDSGGRYKPHRVQKKVWRLWEYFWSEWVPKETEGKPYDIVVNGDIMDGRHHGNTTHISNNLADQQHIAREIYDPIFNHKMVRGKFIIRGTEVHAGPSSENEERLAESLGVKQDEGGNYTWSELYRRLPNGLCHFAHTIGTTSSTSYESSALMREMGEMFTESGRWRRDPPDVIVRSHRHRCMKLDIPSNSGMAICLVTCGWQLKTPYLMRLVAGRLTQPQIGGAIIKPVDDALKVEYKVWSMDRPKEIV